MVARIIQIKLGNDGAQIDPSLNYLPSREQEVKYTRSQELERWQDISLNAIEWASSHLARDAEALAHHVKMIDKLPSFSTKAEKAAEDAEAELTAALRIVTMARKSLAKKRLA